MAQSLLEKCDTELGRFSLVLLVSETTQAGGVRSASRTAAGQISKQ